MIPDFKCKTLTRKCLILFMDMILLSFTYHTYSISMLLPEFCQLYDRSELASLKVPGVSVCEGVSNMSTPNRHRLLSPCILAIEPGTTKEGLQMSRDTISKAGRSQYKMTLEIRPQIYSTI